MLDFLMISTRPTKRGGVEIYPRFIVKKSDDLMIRGGDFYAIWVEERGLWSTDEQDALQLIDRELDHYVSEHKDDFESKPRVLHMWDAESGMIDSWHKYCQRQLRDNYHILDENLVFSNSTPGKEDYASKRLPYPLERGNTPSYDRLMSTLYSEEERAKIEWAIGSIVSGDSKHIQKFLVFYGAVGTGKSTVLNIVQALFEGYYAVFDAKALGSSNSAFALEPFKSNPLVAIQHDGDLSRLEDNTRINSLVSHEYMTVNEKFKSQYSAQFKCFLFMGTNKPVKITDAKSGLIRRLIDVYPSGSKLPPKEYSELTSKIKFELGGIAQKCLDVYLEDPGKYNDYIPTAMLGASNDFYNFVLDSFHVFSQEDGASLKAAWEMYKTYCDEAKVSYPLSKRVFKEELRNYFREYAERLNLEDGQRVRSYYSGFRKEKFDSLSNRSETPKEEPNGWLTLDALDSNFDIDCSGCPAQYAGEEETPLKKWASVKTTLAALDTSKLHYVRVPENHIVIDFDLVGEDGEKSLEKNVEAASQWPPTYAELSKSGKGLHLHYVYSGDPARLSRVYAEHIEVKVFSGKTSLRRKLTKCNGEPIATISSGLPLKGEKKMVDFDSVKSEKHLRAMIKKNLAKGVHDSTKCSIDFINKLLTDAYESDLKYDVSDMRSAVLGFAACSSHQADYCVKLVGKMPFRSKEPSESASNGDAPLIFYDVEVFPNLFLVNWKAAGEGKQVVRMINPSPTEVEELMRFNLVGFNCRRYDNHILYARMLGYDNAQLYDLSQRIVTHDHEAFFKEAYNVSYTDVYDFCSKKQSLKKWEIELGIHHQELGLPWDEPVPEEMWEKVAEYCDNDVLATEAVFNARKADFLAREILADVAGMSVNSTTNTLTTRIIFGKEQHPQLVYTDLATGKNSLGETDERNAFPGYEFVYDHDEHTYKNMYRGVDLGKGGYVYAEPGMYTNVALLDVASLHPHSIIAMNCFGEYTKNFQDLMDARLAVKHRDLESAKGLLGGQLAKYLVDDEEVLDALAYALKIAINSVYGLTSAAFENPFRDLRNTNNIVALRGALFMKTLQDEVAARGFTVAHIKTDSIKIPNATPEIIEFCMEFASKYGYTFEHEATYSKMCLVNDAVYIAKYKDGKHAGEWAAVGAQFQVPYVFKTLFSKEPVGFEDTCETKSVSSAIFLDMDEGLPDVSEPERVKFLRTLDPETDHFSKKDVALLEQYQDVDDEELAERISEGHRPVFIGRVGSFCPVKAGAGGGLLMRQANKPGEPLKLSAVGGSKGYRWMEAEMVRQLGKEGSIDRSYYDKLVDDAVAKISEYGDFEWFVAA